MQEKQVTEKDPPAGPHPFPCPCPAIEPEDNPPRMITFPPGPLIRGRNKPVPGRFGEPLFSFAAPFLPGRRP